jgi:hypothetical protein
MQAYNKKGFIIGSIVEKNTYTETTTKHDSAPRLPNCNQEPQAHMSHTVAKLTNAHRHLTRSQNLQSSQASHL